MWDDSIRGGGEVKKGMIKTEIFYLERMLFMEMCFLFWFFESGA